MARTFVFLLLLSLYVGTFVQVYGQKRPDFRVTREEVLVDVVAADKGGNYITDLKLEEVLLLEDGKEQKINFFEFQRTNQPPTAQVSKDQRTPVKPLTAASSAEFARPTRNISLVFLLDLRSILQNDLVYVQKSMRQFLEERALPGDRFMLATLEHNLRIREPFTEEIPRLLKSMEEIRSTAARDRYSLARFIEEELVSEPEIRGRVAHAHRLPPLTGQSRLAEMKAQSFLTELESEVHIRAEILSAFAGHLRSIPGRKHVVFYSSGFPLTPGWALADAIESFTGAVTSSLRDYVFVSYAQSMIDQANRAQVSFYCIDARGLVAPAGGGAGGAEHRRSAGFLSSLGVYSRLGYEDITAPQELLTSLASGTGGRYFLNSNDLERGIRGAYEDSKNYYLLGYSPQTQRKEGKLHRIEIKVSRPDVRLRYRKGYIETEMRDISKQDLMNALKFPELFQDFSLTVRALLEAGHLRVTTVIPTDALGFWFQEGRYRCPIQVSWGLWDSKGKMIGGSLFGEEVELDLGEEELNALRKSPGMTSSAERSIEAGKYQLTVVVRQGIPTRVGTWTGLIEVE